ncbi:putative sulfate exporter family transporter [Terrabacter sp. NPDC080008]|uniref:YeiH family protein n=1 Tax=Terrabacter sp. NPDC080008 TaxID=3155176 RepID=UPI00344C8EBB
MPTTERTVPAVWRIAPPLVAALAATLVSRFVPLPGPLLLALIVGAVVANTAWSRSAVLDGHASVTRLLLRIGVVMIGLRLPIGDIAAIGLRGVAVVVLTVCATFVGTRLVGRRLRLDEGFVTVLATGFSICGAAAIAAVSDTVRVRQRDVALAVAMVTLFGSGMIIALPWLAHALGLTVEQSAIWAGASIHEVAQVVAAASIVGTGAVAIATTVKLGRVALLAPTYGFVAKGSQAAGRSVPLVPWFLAGFLVAVVLRSTGIVPAGALAVADVVTNVLLAAGMFGLGLGFRLADLWPVPRRALALAIASTVIAAGVSLSLVVALY